LVFEGVGGGEGGGEPAAEHGGEAVGVLDVGQVSAVGEHRQPTVGQAPHRGAGLLDGQQIVEGAPHDQGRRGESGKSVEQDLALSLRPEQGAGHRGGGLELAWPAAELVLLGEELGRDPPGLCEQHGRGHGGADQVAAGHPADHADHIER
jgi:hypothetical protein